MRSTLKFVTSAVMLCSLAACGGNDNIDAQSERAMPGPPDMELAADDGRLAAGSEHVLAVHVDGRVFAWGRNDFGQLGINNNTSSNTAVNVVGLSAVKSVSAGELHSLALNRDG